MKHRHGWSVQERLADLERRQDKLEAFMRHQQEGPNHGTTPEASSPSDQDGAEGGSVPQA